MNEISEGSCEDFCSEEALTCLKAWKYNSGNAPVETTCSQDNDPLGPHDQNGILLGHKLKVNPCIFSRKSFHFIFECECSISCEHLDCGHGIEVNCQCICDKGWHGNFCEKSSENFWKHSDGIIVPKDRIRSVDDRYVAEMINICGKVEVKEEIANKGMTVVRTTRDSDASCTTDFQYLRISPTGVVESYGLDNRVQHIYSTPNLATK